MPTKTKKKKAWLWILLSLVVFFIIATIGIAVMIYWIAQVSNNKTSDSVDYYSSESYQGEDSLAKEAVVEEGAPEYIGNEDLDVVEDKVISTAAGEITEKKVIKTGSMKIEVEEIDDAGSEITDIAQASEGFVQSANTRTDSDGKQNSTITIKVPADKFENVYEQIKKLAINIEREDISGKDVTEEYVDLQAQLKNYRAEEEQYLSILEKATTIDDILKVTKQLSIVRGNIETIEGRLKYLESVTDFSTITIYLVEEVRVEVPTSKWRPLNNFKTAFSYWVQSLQWLADVLVWAIIFVGPVAILIWLIVWAVRRKSGKNKQ